MQKEIAVDHEKFKEDYIPPQLIDREKQERKILDSVKNRSGLLLKGKTGTGKTVTLRKAASQKKRLLYTNAVESETAHQIMVQAYRQAGNPLEVHETGVPTSKVAAKLGEKIKKKNLVLAVDEAEAISSIEDLRTLFEVSNGALILATNNFNKIERRAGKSLISRLRALPKVTFPEYNPDQLVKICEKRAENAVKNMDSLSDDLRKVISNSDDARHALSMLYQHLTGSDPDLEPSKYGASSTDVEQLNKSKQVLLEIVNEQEEVKPRELHNRYERRMDDPVTERTQRKYLNRLDRAGLIESIGKARGRRYRSVDYRDAKNRPISQSI